MDTRDEEYFIGILQKYVPIEDFEPAPNTVEATEEFDTFVANMKSAENRDKCVRAAWTHTSGSDPRVYQTVVENGIEWKVREALEGNGLFVDKRFMKMCDEGKQFPGTKPRPAGLGNSKWTMGVNPEGTKKFFGYDDKITDEITDEIWKSASGITLYAARKGGIDMMTIANQVGLWRFILGRDLNSSRFDEDVNNLSLFDMGLGELAYAIFQLLVKGIPDEVERNVWFGMNHKTLRQVWLKEDNVAPSRFWYEAAVLVIRVFLRMFLVLGVENTRTVFTIMGTKYEIDNSSKKEQNKLYAFPETLGARTMNTEGKWIKGLKLERPSGTSL